MLHSFELSFFSSSSKGGNVRYAIQNATHARENDRETDEGSEQTKINDGLDREERFPRRRSSVSSLSSVHVCMPFRLARAVVLCDKKMAF